MAEKVGSFAVAKREGQDDSRSLPVEFDSCCLHDRFSTAQSFRIQARSSQTGCVTKSGYSLRISQRYGLTFSESVSILRW